MKHTNGGHAICVTLPPETDANGDFQGPSHRRIRESEDDALRSNSNYYRRVARFFAALAIPRQSAIGATVKPIASWHASARTRRDWDHNGAFISRDGGSSWKSLSEHLPGKDTHALGIDASDPNRIVAFIVGRGVYETRDGGRAWTKLSQPPNEPMGTATVRSNNIMIPAMMPDMNMTGILRSTDDGKHWSLVDRSVGGMALANNPRHENLVYLSGMGTLYVSGNGGKTWSTRALPATAEVVAPAADGSLYAAGYPDKRGILWRSRDSGRTWARISR